MSERDPESAPIENSADAVWTSTLDKRYLIVVRRLAPYRGELTIRDESKLIHREEVGLMYDAIFGPDMDDVENWREIAVKIVDALTKS